MPLASYKDLVVWKKSMQLNQYIDFLYQELPRYAQYSIGSQLLKSAVSIPSNIAEGYGSCSRKDYVRFLSYAYASGKELETQLRIVGGASYGSQTDYNQSLDLLNEVNAMLFSMIRTLKKQQS